jgi:hypothetical protein
LALGSCGYLLAGAYGAIAGAVCGFIVASAACRFIYFGSGKQPSAVLAKALELTLMPYLEEALAGNVDAGTGKMAN